MLDERAVRVHHDLELAAGGLLHVLDELLDVARVELAVGIGRGHVPLGLRLDDADRKGARCENDAAQNHGFSHGGR